MAFSFDLSSDLGKVRLLIPDRVAEEYVFDDVDILAFLEIEDGIKRSTAIALETIASDNAMTLKVIRLLDLSTDGAKVSDALLKRAQGLRDQADTEDESGEMGFDIAEMVYDDFSFREKIVKEAERSG